MDLFLLEDRDTSVIHLVYYNSWYGQKYTFCGKYYSNKSYPQVMALSGPIQGCCTVCASMAASSFSGLVNNSIRNVRKKNDKILFGLYYSAKGGSGVSRKYMNMDEGWYKLSKYKFKIKGNR